MITKMFTVLFALTMVFTALASAQVQENFTLNFPSGNGTTTFITDSTVATEQANILFSLIPIALVLAIVIGIIYLLYVHFRGVG